VTLHLTGVRRLTNKAKHDTAQDKEEDMSGYGRRKKAKAKARNLLTKWTPFTRGTPITHTGDPRVDTKETWVNSLYQVFVYRQEANEGLEMPKMVHLSIKTHERTTIRDWRDLQRIKNELCGTTCEGVELFPAESRMTDLANQYHLWVLEPGVAMPFGFNDGRMVSSDEATMKKVKEKTGSYSIPDRSRQRDFKPHHSSDDCPEVGPVFQAWLGEEE